nr:hypothetical protein [uncultured Blautia sp.]
MKRSAARELTCSQSLNSSAVASSLSVWGRWISLALLCTSLTDSPLLPAPPAFLQPLGAVAAVGRVVLRVGGGGYGERDCCGRLCVVLQVGGCGYGECVSRWLGGGFLGRLRWW